jgi:hypothetical protein
VSGQYGNDISSLLSGWQLYLTVWANAVIDPRPGSWTPLWHKSCANGRAGALLSWSLPATPEIAIFDPAVNQWSAGADMSQACYSPATQALDGRIHAVGGRPERERSALDLVESCTP